MEWLKHEQIKSLQTVRAMLGMYVLDKHECCWVVAVVVVEVATGRHSCGLSIIFTNLNVGFMKIVLAKGFLIKLSWHILEWQRVF